MASSGSRPEPESASSDPTVEGVCLDRGAKPEISHAGPLAIIEHQQWRPLTARDQRRRQSKPQMQQSCQSNRPSHPPRAR